MPAAHCPQPPCEALFHIQVPGTGHSEVLPQIQGLLQRVGPGVNEGHLAQELGLGGHRGTLQRQRPPVIVTGEQHAPQATCHSGSADWARPGLATAKQLP